MASLIKRAALALLTLCLTLGLVEFALAITMRFPSHMPQVVLWALREYYDYYERNILQFDSNISEHSSYLGYRLRTNTSVFNNREFSTLIEPNSKHLRDTEESLRSPQIIVLGDSYTFGWGVNSDERFSNILGKLLNRSVANVSMSSYGTAREFMLLRSLEPVSADYVVIQYIHNDYGENITYLKHTNSLPVMSANHFLIRCHQNRLNKRYWPGKHIRYLFPKLVGYVRKGINRGIVSSNYMPPPVENEVAAFINILLKNADLLHDKKIIVFSINDWGLNEDNFVSTLVKRINENPNQVTEEIRTLIAFDASYILNNSNYFLLDHHINAQGHSIIADYLSKIILYSETFALQSASLAQQILGEIRIEQP